MAVEPVSLSRFEQLALTIAERANSTPGRKRLQYLYHRYVNRQWVRRTISRRLFVDNIEWLTDLVPDRGIMFAANHRSFFDQYVNMLALYEVGAAWPQRIYFPVRSNFFYESFPGVLINLLIGGMTMYPPIFRDPAKARLNKEALDTIARILDEPGALVGVHPEGTRGKGPDPYELLPAQPGVGQMALHGRPILVPFFINGIGNSIPRAVAQSYRRGAQRDPVILVYGDPVDYSDLAARPPRASLYLKMAKRMNQAIEALMPREREIRAACAAGDIGPDHPSWLLNRSVY
jgi:1-acyl-sn-glycerol-3-phosphate acyltransferase